MINDYKDKAVLITGGTKGIGLATGLAFGRVESIRGRHFRHRQPGAGELGGS